MNAPHWRAGNRARLLENGEEYYPRVFEAVAAARKEILIETFILFDDPVGRKLQQHLIDAAGRGVQVDVTVDGYGSAGLSDEFVEPMTRAGIRLHVFDPQPRILSVRVNVFRRLHRKLVVADRRVAFIGGINFSYDHLRESGDESKQDYAVELEGPIVGDIHGLMMDALGKRAIHGNPPRQSQAGEVRSESIGDVSAALVVRDNHRHRTAIEKEYRRAIREAKHEVLIANAYFLPGFRLLRELRRAARRGVQVKLILQGNPDQPMLRTAAETLYDHLMKVGIRIYEFCERPMHGKVAVIDSRWSTVGSSNLDPLSLFLNLEANAVLDSAAFGRQLQARLVTLMERSCSEVKAGDDSYSSWIHGLLGYLVFHLLRRFPQWAGLLPAHTPAKHTLPARAASHEARRE